MRIGPPLRAEKWLERLLNQSESPHLLGDYAEIYHDLLSRYSPVRAKIWYWTQLLLTMLDLTLDHITWGLTMILNHLKIALRNIGRNRAYTFINLSGIAVGLALFILALLYSHFHLSYDSFHKDGDRLWAIGHTEASGRMRLLAPRGLTPHLKEIEGVEQASRYIFQDETVVNINGQQLYESGWMGVDPDFLSMFSFEWIEGDQSTALSSPDAIVLADNIAQRYFGEQPALGKKLIIGRDRQQTWTVTGIIKKPPLNSSLRFNGLRPIDAADDSQWKWNASTFVKLSEGRHFEDLTPTLLNLARENMTDEKMPVSFFGEPVKDLLFTPAHISNNFQNQPKEQYYMVLFIATALLLIVCINFMNLATSQAMSRAREVGLRKVVGAVRSQLIKQYLGESLLITFTALPLALGLYALLRPQFVTFMYLETPLQLWDSPQIMGLTLLITLAVGILSGIYPAFVLSSYRPAAIIKGQRQGRFSRGMLRKVMVVIQYTLAVVLLMGALVIQRQFRHVQEVDLGINRSNVLWASCRPENQAQLPALREYLLQQTGVQTVSLSYWIPVDWGSNSPNMKVLQTREDENSAVWARYYPVGCDFIEILEMPLLQGRSFSRSHQDQNAVVISKSLASQLQWDDPVGHQLYADDFAPTIIGVVEDFHFAHVFYRPRPGILHLNLSENNAILCKVDPRHKDSITEAMHSKWQELIPHQPLRLKELDSYFTERFKKSVKGQELITMLSVVSVFFACLGLVSMAAFTLSRMMREIAIRKVLGANVPGMTLKLLQRFFVLVIIANAAGLPLGYFAGKFITQMGWVSRISLSTDLFILAGGVTFATALTAVLWQSLKAANLNPAMALRSE